MMNNIKKNYKILKKNILKIPITPMKMNLIIDCYFLERDYNKQILKNLTIRLFHFSLFFYK